MTLLHEDFAYSCKDACMAWDGATWHIFFSAFDEERSMIARTSSHNLQATTASEIMYDGSAQQRIGMCSPDIIQTEMGWLLIFNSWGSKEGFPNSLYFSESTDLRSWSEPKPLAADLTKSTRVIDGTLAYHGGHWFLICKCPGQTRCAYADQLDGTWNWVSDQAVQFTSEHDGKSNGLHRENFQLIMIDGQWHLLSTDFVAYAIQNTPWLYRLAGNPDHLESWQHWSARRALDIPTESWNSVDPSNAAALLDHRQHDGWFYLIYGGKDAQRENDFCGTASTEKKWPRGWNRLGLARSRDLIAWEA